MIFIMVLGSSMLNALKDIVNPDVVINIATGDKILAVKESAKDSDIKKLNITGIPEVAFAFTLDHQPGGPTNRLFKQLSCYVNPACGSGANKGCDLVLLSGSEKNKWKMLIFDLKSKKPDKTETKRQLLNSEIYVRYLLNMIGNHYEIDTDTVEFKRTIVTTARGSMRKAPTYVKNRAPTKTGEYHTESVKVNYINEATINLGALLRG